MKIRLRGAKINPDQQKRNDRHKPWVVIAVVCLMCLFVFLFTQAASVLNLPLPENLSDSFGLSLEKVFDDDHNVDTHLYIQSTKRFKSDDERLILFVVITASFLCGYFLPLKYKRASFVIWFPRYAMCMIRWTSGE